MSAMDNATRFFHACESLQGYEGCRQWIGRKSKFESQCEPLHDVCTVEQYVDWVRRLGTGPLRGCGYRLHSASWDEAQRTAMFFATLEAANVGDGGPVPPTGRATSSHYVYVLQMGPDDRVRHMVRIWNAPWAMRQLGWL